MSARSFDFGRKTCLCRLDNRPVEIGIPFWRQKQLRLRVTGSLFDSVSVALHLGCSLLAQMGIVIQCHAQQPDQTLPLFYVPDIAAVTCSTSAAVLYCNKSAHARVYMTLLQSM